MRVVFDTNVVVSAGFWRGAPFDCLAAWANGRCEAIISPPLVAEYEEVYAELLPRYADRSPVDWPSALSQAAELVFPVERIRGVSPDPFDDMVLECAVASEADVLVSGDKKHLLPLGRFRGIRILAPAEFIARIGTA